MVSRNFFSTRSIIFFVHTRNAFCGRATSIECNRERDKRSASMYDDSEDEYTFVVLSRSNSFKKVWKAFRVQILCGENPTLAPSGNFLLCDCLIDLSENNFKFFFHAAQPASYGKKVSF